MPVVPRLTYPGRRVDAVRGMAAVERGPLVYCFEQADQPAGTDLEDLAITAGGLRECPAAVDGVGQTVLIEADAVRLPATGGQGLPCTQAPPGGQPGGMGAGPAGESAGAPVGEAAGQPAGEAAGGPATATAIPYFQWDNRDGRAMRVWIPLAAETNR